MSLYRKVRHSLYQTGMKRKDMTYKLIIDDEEIDISNLSSIEFKVAKWIKFNALHNYIIANFQGSSDNKYIIHREDLSKIIDYCKSDIDYLDELGIKDNYFVNAELSRLNFQPTSGFFEVRGEINITFYNNLKSTIEQLTTVLEEPGLFYYTPEI